MAPRGPRREPLVLPATEDYGHYEELQGEPGERLFPEHPVEPDSFSEGGPPGRPKAGAGVPDFLPSAQRALYLRIQQKQQEEEERARRLAESSKQDRENEEGRCPPRGERRGRPGWPAGLLHVLETTASQGGPERGFLGGGGGGTGSTADCWSLSGGPLGETLTAPFPQTKLELGGQTLCCKKPVY